jgi:hypothetical protein
MRRIKVFEDFILESNSENIINKILTALTDDIQHLIGKHEEAFQKQFERPMSAYDKELTRLNIIWDMVKAIEIYTLHTDVLVTVSSSISHKGNLEIFAQIQRGDQVYPFITEVIYAGGYNIQRLHYRYITKTSIPKTGSKAISTQYANEIKKLSKLEKLNLEIERYEERIKKNEETLQSNRTKTDTQIWNEIRSGKDYYEWPTWQEIVKRGADKNYEYSEELFNQKRIEDDKRNLEFWKSMNISNIERQTVAYQKEVVKLKKKLEQSI